MLKQQCALRHVANLEYVILIPSKLVFSLTPQRRSNECQFLLNSLCFDPTGARTHDLHPQALVSFKTYMSPPLPYFKVNIYPFPLPHFASIYFAYLWSFRWPNYIVTLTWYFSFRLPHLNIATGPLSDELAKNSQRKWLSENLSRWNGYSHFRSGLNWFRKFKKGALKIKCQ